MPNKIVSILCILFLIVTLASNAFAAENEIKILINKASLHTAINRSAKYMATRVKPDGMFSYLENLNTDVEVEDTYNILRHAGAIYAMGMHYQLDPTREMRVAMSKAGKYLQQEAIGTVPGEDTMLAVWSRPDVHKREDVPIEAKLGGNGLGLAALASLEKIQPGFTPLPVMQKLGNFIIHLQKPDGSFNAKYNPAEGGAQDKWQSLYYPGEASLGLLMLYELDQKEAWLNSALNALTYLADSRTGQQDVPPDHWALLATAKLFELSKKHSLEIPENKLIHHATQISTVIIEDQIVTSKHPRLIGSFDELGRTTPAATRLEGLLGALIFIPYDHPLRPTLELVVHRGMSFLLNTQIISEPFMGAFPRSIAQVNSQEPEVQDFNERATEIRIDYVQHALSAMIQYYNFVTAKEES